MANNKKNKSTDKSKDKNGGVFESAKQTTKKATKKTKSGFKAAWGWTKQTAGNQNVQKGALFVVGAALGAFTGRKFL